MARIRKSQMTAFRVKQSIEKRDEAVRRQIFTKQSIKAFAHDIRGHGCSRKSVDRCLQIGHYQSRGQSMAGNVPDAESQSALIQTQYIVVVATDNSRRPPNRRNLVTRCLRYFSRQQSLLNPQRFLHLILRMAQLIRKDEALL